MTPADFQCNWVVGGFPAPFPVCRLHTNNLLGQVFSIIPGAISGGQVKSEALLYPVLHRMEKEGVIRSRWKMSEEKRMRKYYALTDFGACPVVCARGMNIADRIGDILRLRTLPRDLLG